MGALWLVLAAALLFYQLSNPAKVEIKWETATEQETAGFFLYRSKTPDGEFEPINADKIIDSKGNPVSGASYTYIDANVIPGETYYYILEEVEYNLSRNRYEKDMFAYTVPRVSWWVVILTAGSIIIGLALLITGLKEDRSL
jgi:hypothetical protein